MLTVIYNKNYILPSFNEPQTLHPTTLFSEFSRFRSSSKLYQHIILEYFHSGKDGF